MLFLRFTVVSGIAVVVIVVAAASASEEFFVHAFEPAAVGILRVDFTAGHRTPSREFLGFVVACAVFHDVKIVVAGVQCRKLFFRHDRHLQVFSHADILAVNDRVALAILVFLAGGESQNKE